MTINFHATIQGIRKDGRMEGWKDGRMEGWKDGRMEEWKNGRMEEWKNGRKDEGVTESVNKKNLEDPVRICVAFTYLHMFEFCKTIL
jgi:predicted transposase YdaD